MGVYFGAQDTILYRKPVGKKGLFSSKWHFNSSGFVPFIKTFSFTDLDNQDSINFYGYPKKNIEKIDPALVKVHAGCRWQFFIVFKILGVSYKPGKEPKTKGILRRILENKETYRQQKRITHTYIL